MRAWMMGSFLAIAVVVFASSLVWSGVPCAGTSDVSAGTYSAAVGDTVDIYVTVKDCYGEALGSRVCNFYTDRGVADIIIGSPATTDANGDAQAKVTTMVVGESYVYVNCEGVVLGSSPAIEWTLAEEDTIRYFHGEDGILYGMRFHGEEILYGKHFHGDSLIDLTAPISTFWHELYPDYCGLYHFNSWEDNGDGILNPCDQIDMVDLETGDTAWYHVDDITITIFVEKEPFQPPELPESMYIEAMAGYEFYDSVLVDPDVTEWHEIWPRFCRRYNWDGWIDTDQNGQISPCDTILLHCKTPPEDSVLALYHVVEVATDMELCRKPECTQWHELYPEYCRRYHLNSWEDNDDHRLSPSDQIDMVNKITGDTTWYHVDDVTVTIFLQKEPFQPPQLPDSMYVESLAGYDLHDSVLVYPDIAGWHEIWPRLSRVYKWDDWIDTDQSGYISPCDTVLMHCRTWPDSCVSAWYHVVTVTTDIEVSRKPTCTQWHELYPVFCREYHLSSWWDNCDDNLSPCDEIEMVDKLTGDTTWFHVEDVTVTIFVEKEPFQPPQLPESMYVESLAGYDLYDTLLVDPDIAEWHEIWPTFCRRYNWDGWVDTDRNGYISPCDTVLLHCKTPPDSCVSAWYHVVEVNTDIIVGLRQASIDDWGDPPAPSGLRLEQNYPNPVARATDIRYSLPRACWVKLEIYNILGQKVATLIDEAQEAGYKSVRWDCTNQSGGRVASGLYFYRLKAGDAVQKRKMIVLR